MMLHNIGQYPQRRMRRNRQGQAIRDLLQETHLTSHDFIWPIFVTDGQTEDIVTMPYQQRLSYDDTLRAAEKACKLSIPALALFPQIAAHLKNPTGDEALNENNIICQRVHAIKQRFPELMLWCDVALDPYTDHGHDGILDDDDIILNDETIRILCQQAITLADAGCDTIAPSDMMDGRIGVIRHALDAAGYHHIRIVSYSAKYASAFYGPFRDAVGSKSLLRGDKKTYQMNPANSNEALHEIALDLQEGADMVMIKPAMAYMDIIRRVKDEFAFSTIAYQVSGEYTMLLLAAKYGNMDETQLMLESLIGLKRAGADGILSYYAPILCQKL